MEMTGFVANVSQKTLDQLGKNLEQLSTLQTNIMLGMRTDAPLRLDDGVSRLYQIVSDFVSALDGMQQDDDFNNVAPDVVIVIETKLAPALQKFTAEVESLWVKVQKLVTEGKSGDLITKKYVEQSDNQNSSTTRFMDALNEISDIETNIAVSELDAQFDQL